MAVKALVSPLLSCESTFLSILRLAFEKSLDTLQIWLIWNCDSGRCDCESVQEFVDITGNHLLRAIHNFNVLNLGDARRHQV